MRAEPYRLDRRRFVAGASVLPAVCGLALPAGGAFVAGRDRLRVGIVGCGGRGTGAALQAVDAAPGVTVTAMADAFFDQLESSAAVLAARAPAAFDCPRDRRFVGLDAWRHVVEADVDLVILATPPAFRPLHAVAAVRAGRHVWCEKPGAVDAAGVGVLATACAEAAARGLSFASGLARRHDAASAALVAGARGGAAGRPLEVTVRADIGLPWSRPAGPGWTSEEAALRNWISHPRLSGGDFVERHVAALDTALWVLGDADPTAVVPDGRAGGVRYLFADGRQIRAALSRRPGATGTIEEFVRCERGLVDLRRPAAAPCGDRHPLAVAMRAVVATILSGSTLDAGTALRRATLAAIAGRTAIERGSAVAWAELAAAPAPSARPLQSAHS